LSMRLDNVVLPLLIAGMIQGLFEIACSVDSTVDWDLSDEGLLTIQALAT